MRMFFKIIFEYSLIVQSPYKRIELFNEFHRFVCHMFYLVSHVFFFNMLYWRYLILYTLYSIWTKRKKKTNFEKVIENKGLLKWSKLNHSDVSLNKSHETRLTHSPSTVKISIQIIFHWHYWTAAEDSLKCCFLCIRFFSALNKREYALNPSDWISLNYPSIQ